ncbi:MAG: DUF1566 domain-containing protein [Gammaproteobacteria bacterium]|nr:DUF1566 domain-containing protein [Gammaproteobacteria bacterium]MBU1556231.1 DUF1566 domain-containing protein [Gammaproteobacteria bacterium]MBU2071551.1 DUF1566 domain-containing protein [Gammaproteobacteria bacterium]MBU2184041.1 DUF1566 domain-containing protein [Gammaproteobacteria bacterium]MBU2206873.1 DUF1566 domain-containing protein [Gammaproteobacteria bacterium]
MQLSKAVMLATVVASVSITVSCSSPGNYADVPYNYIVDPESRYQISQDGMIVTDKHTKLQWMRCSAGQYWNGSECRGRPSRMEWAEAKKYAESLNYAGHDDWRLPTNVELTSLLYCSAEHPNLVNGSCVERVYYPSIVPSVFPATYDNKYWTSTDADYDRYGSSMQDNYNKVWAVSFGYATVYDDYGKGNLAAVRLVRKSLW